MSDYSKITNFLSKDSLALNDPAKYLKGSEIDAEYNAIAAAIATKADTASPTMSSPTITGTITAAIANFSGLVTAALGLTVSGAAFNSRGITDNATAKALTLSGSGANSVTIANSATNPTIGTSAGALLLAPATGFVQLNGVTTSGLLLNAATGNSALVAMYVNGTEVARIIAGAAENLLLGTSSTGTPQVSVTHTASADRYITLTGGVSGSGTHATIGASSGRINSTSGFSISGGASTAADVSTNRVQFKNNSMLIVDSSRSADAKVVETVFGSGNFLIRYANDAYTDAASILAASGTSSRVTAVGLCYDTNDNPAVNIESVASQDRYITLTGSNGGNPTIGTSAGSLALSEAVVAASTVTVGTNLFANGYIQVNSNDATPAGGAVNTGLFLGVSAIGVYFGSGAPTVSAAKGSLYLRSDGTATNNRMYVNTDGGTTWTAVTTAA